ncbi:hypothetical protein SDC9_134161 [bioreactor metagenome]|uniref:Uncharacterized protein n=1 Tax=bioreactor metagenome TaxID=1076179 RepID=A0A645DDF1_9ZZZZ
MDRMHPAKAVAQVNLFHGELLVGPPVGVKAPGKQVSGPGARLGPRRLQLCPPARLEHLVQIVGNADIHVRGNMIHGRVSGGVKAPGFKPLLINHRPPGPEPLCGFICGAGIGHHHQIGLADSVHPAVHELLLIFTDGVNADLPFFHWLISSVGFYAGHP